MAQDFADIFNGILNRGQRWFQELFIEGLCPLAWLFAKRFAKKSIDGPFRAISLQVVEQTVEEIDAGQKVVDCRCGNLSRAAKTVEKVLKVMG
jgi:hypothetical protein